MVSRRTLLSYLNATAVLSTLGISPFTFASGRLKLAKALPFSYDWLINHAKSLSHSAYQPENLLASQDKALLKSIDYDTYMHTQYNSDYAVFASKQHRFPVTFFMVNNLNSKVIKAHVVEAGKAREIEQSSEFFKVTELKQKLPTIKGPVFSGFRVLANTAALQDNPKDDWVSFLGASYFRAIGEQGEFGISARGIAINTVQPGMDEEFPDFTEFWFETPPNQSDYIVVYALLNGPSITGAYRFTLHRTKGVIMEVDSHLFIRKDIALLGIAPLTSMYWFSKTVKNVANDWRPEVHDSEGLAIWNGKGEHLWRPLNNPLSIMSSSFSDNKPRGFGLLQKDRHFDSYLDKVHYEKRPDLWVEPLDDWGEGAVRLIEIPTDDEIYDNIVAMWVPEKPAKAGDSYHYRYRLHWLSDEPFPSKLARCKDTRLGRGGLPGSKRPKNSTKFVVSFQGDIFKHLPKGAEPAPILWSSRGKFENIISLPVADNKGDWLIQFDLVAEQGDPVELRLFLKASDETISETWIYQYLPMHQRGQPSTPS